MKNFEGRVAVVTGAASGIGRALAERFAAEGMHVVLADIDSHKLYDLASAIQNANVKVLAIRTDVAQAGEVENLAERTIAEFGSVHLLCNNAGLPGEFLWTWEQSAETWERILGVNLFGVIHGIRAFVPRMLGQNSDCHIVNTASVAGVTSLPFLAPYHVTKHAVVTLSESLHFELKMLNARIGVTVLCPGPVQTPILNAAPRDSLNLPGEFAEHKREPAAWHLAWQKLLVGGRAPAEMAEAVIEAIRNERFYAFPAPELMPVVRTRMEDILEQHNPELTLPPEIVALINEGRVLAINKH